MTRVAPFRQVDLARAIRAARAAGLLITGIKPDGTVLTAEPGMHALDTPHAANDRPEGIRSPEDVLAELKGWGR
jgi:hypothetical protein